MLFPRWQHHLRFRSGLPYAPLKAMVTKISKWSGIQDSFRITPKIESLVVFVIPDMPSKFQKDPSITFWVILLTHRQTDKQTKSSKNITSLAKVTTYIAVVGVKLVMFELQSFRRERGVTLFGPDSNCGGNITTPRRHDVLTYPLIRGGMFTYLLT